MQRKKIISRTLTTAVMLALYIGGAQPSIISAQEYTDQITGGSDMYAAHGIRTTVGKESTYTFAKGDVVKWTNAYPAVEVWAAGTHLKFTTPLNLQLDARNGAVSGIYVATQDYNIPGKLTAQDVTITGQSTGEADNGRIYISGIETYTADIQMKNLHIDVTADGKPQSIADGIFMGRDLEDEDSEHLLTVTGDTNIKAVSKNSYYAWAAGIKAQDQAKMNFGKLTIATEATAEDVARTNGIFAAGNSEINAGETHINVKGNAVTEGYSYGLNAIYNSQITLGDGSSIYAESSGEGEISAIGVRAGKYSTVNLGITDIRAENNSAEGTVDVLFVEDGAVLNMAGGTITGTNNANSGLFNAINAYGEDPDPTWHTDTIVNINQGTTNDVVIVGDVHAANTAIVNLNLNTEASSITGNLDQSGPYVDKDDSAGSINLTLANKATWHAMGQFGNGYSYLENLTLNDGSITMTNEEVQNIDINHLQGTGGELTLEADASLNTGFFRVNNADTDAAAVHTSYAGINADNVKDAAGLEGLVKNSLKIHDDSAAKFDVQVHEGLLIGQMQSDTINHIDGNAIANVKIAQSTTVDAISHLQNAAALSWRQEDATLSKRLGDLRQGDGDQGFWVRLNRGEFKYDNAKNQNNFFQMGYDKAGGDWHYGAAISRNSGKTTYGDATAKNRSLALTLYGTWLGDKGHYADIVLKEGRLSNDYDISAPIGFTHGQYKTWGSSISAEYGREIAMGDKAYFTPQAQLSWLRISGKDYTTANGIAISQDSQSSTIGRLGFELGSRLGDNGNVYAKASVLHDFGGSADTRLSYNGISTTYSNDLGDTWYEAGIGFNLKTKDNSYLYADVSKAFGGDYKTPWQWNVGMRWTF